MREKNLYQSVDRKLPTEIHRQSMTGASTSCRGTVDRYYDGPCGDLWVEYKSLDHMPRSGLVGGVNASKKGCYTPQQYDWMLRRYNNSLSLPHGPNVVGIVGLPNRTAVIQRTPTEWCEGSPTSAAVTIQEIANWIQERCGGSSKR